MVDLSLTDYELTGTTEWLAGDDRVLAFTVTDDSGTPQDIQNATLAWRLYEREYQDPADAVLDESDADVDIVVTDGPNGAFEVRVGNAATTELWGQFAQQPQVTESDGTVSTWSGDVILVA